MIKGAEVAMTVGFVAGLLSITIGIILGAVAGYFGGCLSGAQLRRVTQVYDREAHQSIVGEWRTRPAERPII